MALDTEQFFIANSTPEGLAVLEASDSLQEAMRLFINAPKAENVMAPGARLLGAGKYSFSFLIDGIVMKVSTPTSSQEAFNKKVPLPPEDLSKQFTVLGALNAYLQQKTDEVVAPEQFFVARTPGDVFILAQQYMDGWVSLEDRTRQVYGSPEDIEESERQEINQWSDGIIQRFRRVLGDFALKALINDLVKPEGLNGGNILVPSNTKALDAAALLCIIDQPGGRRVENTILPNSENR